MVASVVIVCMTAANVRAPSRQGRHRNRRSTNSNCPLRCDRHELTESEVRVPHEYQWPAYGLRKGDLDREAGAACASRRRIRRKASPRVFRRVGEPMS